jgi:cell division protease FtsH
MPSSAPSSPDSKTKKTPQKPPPVPPILSKALIAYVLMMLAMLWVWQEAFKHVLTPTIPYSQFKQDLRAGEVVECAVRENEIVGKLQPKPVANPAKKPEATPAKKPEATPAAKEQKEKGQKDKNEKKAAPAKLATPPESLFRTVRIEDPDLVAELEKSGVKFAGERPGFLSQFLWSWQVPNGAMV